MKQLKIKFNSMEDMRKGFRVMIETGLGFSGVESDLFFIPEAILMDLDVNGVKYTVLEGYNELND